MKKLAVIKNQLFKDYIKIVSTDNLEEVLDNPNIPLPFTCEFEVAVEKADELSVEKSSLEAKKDKVTDEEIAAFYKKEQELQKLYSESQSSLLSFKDKKFQALYNEVVEAVKTLQKLKKYDAIVEKTAIYIGSEKIKDVSDDVLNTLKSSEKIDLK